MVRVYVYNDLRGFGSKLHNVRSNLCTWYYAGKKRFCGNYCSRKNDRFNRRCWRHKKRGAYSASLPPVVLLMISASERTYNRDVWIKFLEKSEESGVPFELVIYHEDMVNCTVREPHNLLSRFRPFPDIFGKVLPLRDRHGSINFAQIYLRMLEYGLKVPHAARCIVLTERSVPIRSPVKIYQKAIASKCYFDISYNVKYGPLPKGLPIGPRGKEFKAVNNLCQGLYTTDFLKVSLPLIKVHCEHFGISLSDEGLYTVTDHSLFEEWRVFTGANPCEFWLLNSFLIEENSIAKLKQYVDKTIENDKYTVAEIPQWRDGWKRTFIFRDASRKEYIAHFDAATIRYYNGVDFKRGISLSQIIRYLKRNKPHALFFRQVELP